MTNYTYLTEEASCLKNQKPHYDTYEKPHIDRLSIPATYENNHITINNTIYREVVLD